MTQPTGNYPYRKSESTKSRTVSKMTNQLLLIWLSLIAVSAANAKNNILVLLTDDQDVLLGSFDTAKYMPTVHERLQQKGITFEEGGLVHVPICCPSRSTLLTGKYLHHGSLAKNNSFEGDCYSHDWRVNEEDHNTLAVHAQAAGYTTLYAGKYLNRYGHNKTNIQDSIPKGWDYWLGLEGNSRYYNYTLVEKKPGSEVQLHQHGDAYPDDYLPLVLEDYTLSMLPKLPEPWLAIVSWPSPHGPFTPEPKYSEKYPDSESPKNKDFNATSDSQLAKHWLLRQLGPITDQTASLMEEIYRNRLRTLQTVDDHIGKLLDWLETANTNTTSPTNEKQEGSTLIEALPQRRLSAEAHATTQAMIDRTFIIYTSDNGFQFGQHRLSIDKRHLYEHDVRVPFVVRGPKNHISVENFTLSKETIVSTIDIAPTILEIVLEGIESQKNDVLSHKLRSAIAHMDGLSFWQFLKDLPAQGYNDPFSKRTDLLISYHGEGDPKCGLSECPAPLNGLWWMPDSYNNTYHCVRTMREASNDDEGEDSIYCVFYDDEDFVEYYDLLDNPHQLGNDYASLTDTEIDHYEKRLQELMS